MGDATIFMTQNWQFCNKKLRFSGTQWDHWQVSRIKHLPVSKNGQNEENEENEENEQKRKKGRIFKNVFYTPFLKRLLFPNKSS